MGRLIQLLRNPRLWWGFTLAWFVLLFFLSSLPKLPPGPEVPFQDKILHTIYYSGAGFCVWLALRLKKTPLSARAAFWRAVLFCFAVGLFDEFHQSFVPNRSGNDPGDLTADTLGGILGPVLASPFFAWLARRKPSLDERTASLQA